ncbi:hypothetical protein [Neisseria musculi]|uniref:Uncharacterized protein n=1 Tax=Neisseria musculi TaxID=1815583 RepID=A0A7H1MAZ6_9NEIS|nr:hypothetical protein [Neisseria musculi]QNT58811.1 hypothetical protein H7A79_0740 [Neisseria musculi]
MQHYVVLINPECEEAQRISNNLAETVFPYRNNLSLIQEIAGYLLSQGFPSEAVSEEWLMPLDAFMRALNNEETGLSKSENFYAAHIAWAYSEHPRNIAGALEDICYLLKETQWDPGNVDMKIYDFTSADMEWLYSRHKSAIIQWQSDKGLTLDDLDFYLENVLDKSPHILWEVVYRWALQLVKHS